MTKLQLLGALACLAAVVPSGALAERKIIANGWEFGAASPEELLANADSFDKLAIDGVAVFVSDIGEDGSRILSLSIANDRPWSRSALAKKIPTLKAITAHRSLSESLMKAGFSPPTRIPLEDNAAWANFATNLATAAWLAREGGLKGFVVDAEDYFNTKQFYRVEGDPEYDRAVKLMRQRGREVFGAAFREFPALRILSYWSFVREPSYWRIADPAAEVRKLNDLWPAFLDGMLDVMPPEARFIDGNEYSYGYSAAKHEFYKNVAERRVLGTKLLTPENLEKFRAQWLMASAVYLDMYVNPKGSVYHFGPEEGSRLNHLLMNLSEAELSGDGYVWLWGEKHNLVEWKQVDGSLRGNFGKADEILRGRNWRRSLTNSTWEAVLPGFGKGLAAARNPDKYLEERIDSFRRGDKAFSPENAIQPTEFWTYKGKDAGPGKTSIENGRYAGEGPVRAALHAKAFGVKVDDVYGVRLRARGTNVRAHIYWHVNGQWEWAGYPIKFGEPDADGWRQGVGVGYAPLGAKGVDSIVVQMSISLKEGEQVEYRDVEIHRLAEWWRR